MGRLYAYYAKFVSPGVISDVTDWAYVIAPNASTAAKIAEKRKTEIMSFSYVDYIQFMGKALCDNSE